MECNESKILHNVIETSVQRSIFLNNIVILISIWTVLVNGLVFVCLVSSRNILKHNVNVQLLSLSLTDMLVGITMISPVLAAIPNLFSRSEPCSFLLYMYFVAQAATIYHTFLICVHRHRKEKIECEPQQQNIFKVILTANMCNLDWMFAIL